MDRRLIIPKDIDVANEYVRVMMNNALVQKGRGAFVSTHEILGVLAEEFKELIDAAQDNDKVKFMEELADIAVAAIFGIACVQEDTLDW